jgi:DNA integrity scanning protein DisA with diadenylate cyclase activity
MPSLLQSILEQIDLTAIVDIGITALLIYWLFSLIRGTRAVRLVIGVSVLVVVYALAVAFDLRLLTQILQTGAVVVVVSEENGQISLVERSRIVRNLNEAQLARTIRLLLDPNHGRRRRALGGWRAPREPASSPAVRAPR